MATTANARPARPASAPVIRQSVMMAGQAPVSLLRFLPAAVISAVVHVGLFGLLFLVTSPDSSAGPRTEVVKEEENLVKADDSAKPDEEPPPPQTADIDEQARDTDIDIAYKVNREDVSVPGDVDVNAPVGMEGGADKAPTDIAAPSGLGGGLGGAQQALTEGSGSNLAAGGYNGGMGGPLAGTFYGRSGATKQKALREGGGTTASEAAVKLGIDWIVRHQAPDGHWSLSEFNRHGHCNCQDRSRGDNPVAATAFGLLPLLGAGYTHKPAKGTDNPYYKNVLRGLDWLMRKQNKRDGYFGYDMYNHGLATIAICEAYGLTKDPRLKFSAQKAVNFIVRAQYPDGGWRYGPTGSDGDISVTGWQVMALKSAQMAELNVPARTMKRAQRFLDEVVMNKENYGYFYTRADRAVTPTRTAIALLCRQYLQGLGPASPIMSKAVNGFIMPNQPVDGKTMYYYYYATQVLHHFGGKNWETWNAKMRDILIREQDKGKTPRHAHQKGSWSPVGGDQWAQAGGRLMSTSLSILTLEVYYRHLPLYRRIVEDKDIK